MKISNRSEWFLRFAVYLTLSICSAIFFSSMLTRAAVISHGTLELLAEDSSIAPGHDFTLGLHFKLEPGWHIYWRNPGDSGEPPRITWQLPQGFTAGEIEWPVPHKLGTPTIVDYGYDGEVLLLVPIHVAANISVPQVAKLDASVRFLICRDMCIPGKAQLSLTLPVKTQGAAVDSATAPMFSSARAHLPRPAPPSWKVVAQEGKDSFRLSVNAGERISTAFFFPLEEWQIDNVTPQQPIADSNGMHLTLHKSDQLDKPISRLKGVLVLPDGQAYVVDAQVRGAAGIRQ